MKCIVFLLIVLSLNAYSIDRTDKIKLSFISPVIKAESSRFILADLMREIRSNTLDKHPMWNLALEVSDSNLIDLTQIENLLKENYPNVAKKLVFIGREKIEIRLFLNSSQVEKIYNEAESFLYSNFSHDKSKLIFHQLKGLNNKAFLADFDKYKFVLGTHQKKLKSRIAVNVIFYANQRKLRQETLWFNAKLFQDVLVISSDIDKYETEFINKITKASRDVLKLKDKPLKNVGSLKNKRVIKPLRKGSILFLKSFENIPDVEHNQKVTLVYEKKGVRLSMQGIAMKSGQIGDKVKVLVKEAKKPIEAIVTSSNYLMVVNND